MVCARKNYSQHINSINSGSTNRSIKPMKQERKQYFFFFAAARLKLMDELGRLRFLEDCPVGDPPFCQRMRGGYEADISAACAEAKEHARVSGADGHEGGA